MQHASIALRAPLPPGKRWSMSELPFDAIERARVADDLQLFYLVACASFIEITTDLYTRNLGEYFAGDDEVTGWLESRWRPEELQHGAALKRYVQTAWPDFDWERAYRGFYDEYSRLCVVESLAPTRPLEMVARCVVEMGTASYYTVLNQASDEPVLRQLTRNIRNDEINHYAHFFHYYQKYGGRPGSGRLKTLRTLIDRLGELDGEDGCVAFKHVFTVRHPERTFSSETYKMFRRASARLAQRHFPYTMTVKMFIRPLEFGPRTQRMVVPMLAYGVRHGLMH